MRTLLRTMPSMAAGYLRPKSTAAVATWVFICALSVFALSQGPALQGYEPETAAVAEGFVRTGEFNYPSDIKPTIGEGIRLPNGKIIGRAGLPEELAAVPFLAVGAALDRISGGGPRYWVDWVKLFYNPAIAALGAALLFGIVRRLGRSVRWGVALSALFSLASIAWPYAKIGMDTTPMLAMIALFAAALATRGAHPGRAAWMVGFCGGAAVASKPYALPAVIAIVAALVPLRHGGVRRFLSVAVPFVLWMVAAAWFNYSRVGNALKTGNSEFEATLAAPLNLLGYFISPGKSIVLYSPLVLIGAMGFPGLWRTHRHAALAALGGFGLFAATVALAPFWSDETWGPRYIVPVAWIGLLGIPWFVTSLRRRRVLGLVTLVAVGVQLVGVAVRYDQILDTVPPLVGSPVLTYPRVPVPLGRDSVRWVPQISPLLIQSSMLLSRSVELVGAGPLTYSYRPFAGTPHSITFEGKARARADLWWLNYGQRALLAPLLLFVAVFGVFVLGRCVKTDSVVPEPAGGS